MSDAPLQFDHVFKKFKKGELYDSLRDLVPAVTRRLLHGAPPGSELQAKEFWALNDVSFTVNRGEAFGIVGSNGAGKSTILKTLSGILRPTMGRVVVNGRLSALIEVSAGFHPDLTGRENIYLNGTILGMTRAEITDRMDAIVAFSGLEEFLDTPVKRYSSGMFARLGFSVAAHVEPDLLVVDEVLSVGDYLFQQKCIERMSEIMSGGTTVLFVSHNLRAVVDLCQRSLLLERGRVIDIGPSEGIVQQYLTRLSKGRTLDSDRDVRITKVTVTPVEGDARVTFESGSTVDITVEAVARTPHKDVSVVILIADDHQYHVFDTCTQRLGAGPMTIGAGEMLRATFRVNLRLVEGTYHENAYLHRYVTDTPFDRWLSAATFFVTGTPTVKGVAHLVPSLVSCAVSPAEADALTASDSH